MSEYPNESTELVAHNGKARVLAGNRGLEFSDLEGMWRFAVAMVNSRSLKDIDSPEKAILILQAGLEIGLSPVWSLQNIFVVNGRVSVFGDALLGIVRAHKEFEDIEETITGEGDDLIATCVVKRRNQSPTKRTFSVRDAKKANLWGKAGPWTQYPQRMLMMRARSWACRDAFADALRGLGVVEEMRDVEPRQVQAREITKPKLVLPDEEDLSGGESRNLGKTPSSAEDSAQTNTEASVDALTTPAQSSPGSGSQPNRELAQRVGCRDSSGEVRDEEGDFIF